MASASPDSSRRSRPYSHSVCNCELSGRYGPATSSADDERLVDETAQEVKYPVAREHPAVGTDRLGGVEVTATGKDEQAGEETTLDVEKEVVAPVDHRPERLLSGRGAGPSVSSRNRSSSRSARAASGVPEAGGGQFDCQGKAVQPAADVGDDRTGLPVGGIGLDPPARSANSSPRPPAQRVHRYQDLAGNAERFAARRDQPKQRSGADEPGSLPNRRPPGLSRARSCPGRLPAIDRRGIT